MFPRRPFDNFPGPGEYESVSLEKVKTSPNRKTVINPITVLKTIPKQKDPASPGPAAYDSKIIEP